VEKFAKANEKPIEVLNHNKMAMDINTRKNRSRRGSKKKSKQIRRRRSFFMRSRIFHEQQEMGLLQKPVVNIASACLKVFTFSPFTSSVAYFDERCIVENRLIFPLALKQKKVLFFSQKPRFLLIF